MTTDASGLQKVQAFIDVGTAIIGKVGIDQTTPGTTNGVQINAGTALIGKIASVDSTNAIYNGTTAITPVFAAISGATSGNNTLVAADATKKIRVFALSVVAVTAVDVRFESAAGGTALTGVMSFAANGGYVLPYNPLGGVETVANELLNMELGAAVQVSGSITYGLV